MITVRRYITTLKFRGTELGGWDDGRSDCVMEAMEIETTERETKHCTALTSARHR
jgi:hypothetical protein